MTYIIRLSSTAAEASKPARTCILISLTLWIILLRLFCVPVIDCHLNGLGLRQLEAHVSRIDWVIRVLIKHCLIFYLVATNCFVKLKLWNTLRERIMH